MKHGKYFDWKNKLNFIREKICNIIGKNPKTIEEKGNQEEMKK